MGSTTLEERRQRLGVKLGIPTSHSIPSHVAGELDALIREALQKIYARHRWPFLHVENQIALKAGANDGYVDITQGSVNVTGDSTNFRTDLTDQARFRVSGEIYGVESVAGPENLVLDVGALTEIEKQTYALYQDTYVFPSELETMNDAWIGIPSSRLEIVGPEYMAELHSQGLRTGHPEFLAPIGVDANGDLLVKLWPIPWYDEFLHLEGQGPGLLPVNDGDFDSIPDRFSYVVDIWARVKLWEWKKDERYPATMQEGAGELSRMIETATPMQGQETLQLDPKLYGRPHTRYVDGLVAD